MKLFHIIIYFYYILHLEKHIENVNINRKYKLTIARLISLEIQILAEITNYDCCFAPNVSHNSVHKSESQYILKLYINHFASIYVPYYTWQAQIVAKASDTYYRFPKGVTLIVVRCKSSLSIRFLQDIYRVCFNLISKWCFWLGFLQECS